MFPVPWYLILLLVIVSLSMLYFRMTIRITLSSDDIDKPLTINIISNFHIVDQTFSYNLDDILLAFADLKAIAGFSSDRTEEHSNPKQVKSFPANLSDRLRISLAGCHMVLQYLLVAKIEWKTRAGSDDAMHTAIISGLLWSFKGVAAAIISSRTRLQQLVIKVEPDFAKTGINSYLVCILKMRIVHIITIAGYMLVLKVRGYLHGYSSRNPASSH